MNTQDVIPLYEKISELTGQMLLAAKSQNWDALCELESSCAQHVKLLEKEAPQAPLSNQLRTQKIEIIQKILCDDRAIRDLTEPWMRQLQELMHSTGNQRKLENAYGTQQHY